MGREAKMFVIRARNERETEDLYNMFQAIVNRVDDMREHTTSVPIELQVIEAAKEYAKEIGV